MEPQINQMREMRAQMATEIKRVNHHSTASRPCTVIAANLLMLRSDLTTSLVVSSDRWARNL
ncbi:uncharacterized protein EI90DRAFT_3097976 [Cantharellus anzutake]|uniref:uncharacterized protein n=1 Tax=Cantharellus anzutake TaxID=1750568 RepID=UPI0019044B1E|nr:uncharacterized protein EI90DRAFT_3097976 [Cantharellus anzutake]KAF8311120.1 hypothetical protein EI90DRAFT_3097976 [Cantharellus anzutake]